MFDSERAKGIFHAARIGYTKYNPSPKILDAKPKIYTIEGTKALNKRDNNVNTKGIM